MFWVFLPLRARKGQSGVTRLVERVAANRIKWAKCKKPDGSQTGPCRVELLAKGVDDAAAAHNLSALRGTTRTYKRNICGMSVDIPEAFDRTRRDIPWMGFKEKLPSNETIRWFETLYLNTFEYL